MDFQIRPVRFHFIILVSLVILWNVFAEIYGETFLMFLALLAIGIALASFRLEFTIHDDHFTYKVSFFNLILKKKEIDPKEVRKIKFFRIPWARKAAIIRLNKGSSIRLAVMEPPKAYDVLLEFAERHDIEVRKTKDYLTLERM